MEQAITFVRELLGTFEQWPGWAGVMIAMIALLIAALLWQRRRHLHALAMATVNPLLAPLSRMTWKQFELLVSQAFRQRGYLVGTEGRRASDGSVDLVLRRAGAHYLVHCSQWRAPLVEITSVRELHSAIRMRNAAGGFVMTTGSFTREALAFASGRNIQLIDGATLREILSDTAGMSTGIPTIITVGANTGSPPAT